MPSVLLSVLLCTTPCAWVIELPWPESAWLLQSQPYSVKTALWQLRSHCYSTWVASGGCDGLCSARLLCVSLGLTHNSVGFLTPPKPGGPMSEALNTTWRRGPVQLGLLIPYSPLLVAMRPRVGVPRWD